MATSIEEPQEKTRLQILAEKIAEKNKDKVKVTCWDKSGIPFQKYCTPEEAKKLLKEYKKPEEVITQTEDSPATYKKKEKLSEQIRKERKGINLVRNPITLAKKVNNQREDYLDVRVVIMKGSKSRTRVVVENDGTYDVTKFESVTQSVRQVYDYYCEHNPHLWVKLEKCLNKEITLIAERNPSDGTVL